LQWLTLFGTLGGCQAKSTEYDTLGNAKLKWSAGFNLKIWHFDLYDPTWIAGRCSIRAMGEYSQSSQAMRIQPSSNGRTFTPP